MSIIPEKMLAQSGCGYALLSEIKHVVKIIVYFAQLPNQVSTNRPVNRNGL